MKRKYISILLVLALFTSLMPVSVFADDEPVAVTAEAEPVIAPTPEPTAVPTPTPEPTAAPTPAPTPETTEAPSPEPTEAPPVEPTAEPPEEPAAEEEETPSAEAVDEEGAAPVPEEAPEPEEPDEADETEPAAEAPAEEAAPAEEEENGTEAEVTEEAGADTAIPEEGSEEGETAANRAASAYSGTCGDDLAWTLDDEGTLTVSGTGAMTDYSSYSSVPWYSYRGSINDVVVEDGVTSVGQYAFYNCSSLKSIALPLSVTSIGYHTFISCGSLSTVDYAGTVIHKSSISIGAGNTSLTNASWNCTGTEYPSGTCGPDLNWTLDEAGTLTISGTGSMTDYSSGDTGRAPWYPYSSAVRAIVIEDGASAVGSFAFYGLNQVGSVSLPDSVRLLGDSAFYGCSSLTGVTIPTGVTSISESAFSGCSSLTSVSLPSGLQVLGRSAFSGCSALAQITIPAGVSSISDYVFYECSSLTNVTIPEGVTSIGDYAFHYCTSLASVTIPDSVISVGYSAFCACRALSTAVIPEGVTSIGGYAFSGCTSLAAVTIPSSVTTIGINAFSGCSSLTELVIPGSVRSWSSDTFSGCSGLKKAVIGEGITSIPDSTFHNCTSLAEAVIPDSVTSVGSSAFSGCASLGGVTLPSRLDYISDYAFGGCTSLKSITIPASVTSLGSDAFHNCTMLETVTFEGDIPSISSNAFEAVLATACYPYGNQTYTAEKTLGYGGTLDWVAYGTLTSADGFVCVINADGGTLTVTACPDGLTGVVRIPAAVEDLPVTALGENALSGCSGMTALVVPAGVTSIAPDALSGCTGLRTINFGGTQEEWNAIGYTAPAGVTVNFDVFENYFALYAAGTRDTSARVGVPYGENAVLGVTASGTDLSSVTYQWYDSAGRAISGATDAGYTTGAVTETAVFSCKAADGYGAELTVTFEVYASTTPEGYRYIRLDEPEEAVFTSSDQTVYFIYTPDMTGIYVFEGYTDYGYDYHCVGSICSLNKKVLQSSEGQNSFYVRRELTAGVTYLFGAQGMDEDSLTVTLRPSFAVYAAGTTDTSVSIAVPTGETKVLALDVTTPDASGMAYRWYENDEVMPNETGPSLTVGSARATYCCYATYNGRDGQSVYFNVSVKNDLNAYVAGTKKNSAEIVATPGIDTTLSVDVTALDMTGLTCQWYKDGNAVDGAVGRSYTAEPVDRYTEFECEVSDRFGNTKSIYFYVYVDNGFSVRAVNRTDENGYIMVVPGGSVTLEVEAAANTGRLTYSWYRDGDLLDGETGPSLETGEITAPAEYSCWVNDEYGNRGNARFVVGVQNGFYARGDNETDDYGRIAVKYGETVTLSVTASAFSGTVRYQWEKDENEIDGAADRTLTTDAITDSVSYQCVVRDDYGNTRIIWFSVVVDNGFTVAGLNETNDNGEIPVTYGNPVTLGVRASADTGELSFQWYESTEYDRIPLEGETGTSFTVASVTGSKEYVCEVTDCYGTSKRVWFEVIVDNGLTAYVEGTANTETTRYIPLGETSALSVAAKAVTGTISYQWFIVRDPINNWREEEISGATGKTLVTEPVTKFTVFYCKAADIYGGTAIVRFSLYVDAPSEFNVYPVGDTVRTVQVGDDVTLAVRAEGEGEFTCEWREIRGIVPQGWSIGNFTDSLSLPNVQKSGEYVCFVYDRYGNEKQVYFKIAVDNDFQVTSPAQAGPWDEKWTETAPGTNVTLSVNAAASQGPITYSWYHCTWQDWDYTEVQSGDSPRYTVPTAARSDLYYCRVTDKYGTAITVVFAFTFDNSLRAYVTGTTDTYKQITLAAGNNTTLSVTATANTGELTYRWFRQVYSSSGETDEWEQVSGASGNRLTTPAITMHTEYRCEVTDIYNNTVNVSFNITIDNELTAYVDGTNNMEASVYAAEGTNITLTVAGSSASGKLTYQWFSVEYDEDGNRVDTPIPDATGDSWTTPEISGQREEELNYHCLITDKYGNNADVWFYVKNADLVISSESYSDLVGSAKTLTVRDVNGTQPLAGAAWSTRTLWSARAGEPAVTVDRNGKVTAKNVGEATVTASYGEYSESITVTVLFKDVRNGKDYYYEPVYWAAQNGITTGTSASTFSPAASCTRAQIVAFLWRTMGKPAPTTTQNPFRDVKPGDWFYEPVMWAVEKGITQGTSPTTFSPGSPCTRAQIVTFLWRACGSPEPKPTTNPFKDVKESDWFYKPVMWAVQNGITTGTSKTAFSPGKTCIRAQGVTFLYRAMG